ncbi:hypothetical protein GRO01_09810 [Gluconobacter roseus NBRC 3990]|uniref:Uncharacterized protein n=1 Tax=Gluconobacter roseus NBRC 3990 TaxID=1307950 RepID=A0A4Y3M451_9PROT|nr:hypothetical protein AA3990_2007 [Gluconobacter roseus NBRC 3990]GEB03405.1 hypothetical protein GRO01_09810 [Gluconobacter roseus NBRC 3990]GLP93863.1 hypothetical protein GCM10007871_18410 [Gluconobacter roseus NBRC 3990]
MDTDYGAVKHMLPVIGQPQLYRGLQQGIEKQSVVSGGSHPTSALRRQKRTQYCPFLIRQIASCHAWSLYPLSPQAGSELDFRQPV